MRDIPFLFDADPIVAVQQALGLGWPEAWRVLTLLGSNWGVLLVVGIGLWLWGRRTAYALLALVAVDGLLKTGINHLFHVARPDAAAIVKYEQVSLGSFPSGHVSTAAALWGWLAYRGRIPWLLAGVVIVLEGISRIYLGVHFVGDVLGGILLAVLTIALVGWIWPPTRDWLARRSLGFFVGIAVLCLAGVVAGAFFYFGTNPYRWRAGGLVAGLAIGLPLEYRYVRYRPGDVSWGRKLAMILIGGGGIALLALPDQLSGEQSVSLGLATTALAALWTVLGAPTLFSVLGWSDSAGPHRERRVRQAARGLAVATAVLAGVVLYGVGVEPRLILDTQERAGDIPGLPAEWEGASVAVVSDFQVGLWLDNTGMMRRAVDRIVEDRPAAAILAGDFIYQPGSDPAGVIGYVMDILRPLHESGIPTYAVLGNHDWGMPRPLPESQPNAEAARMLRDTLEAVGIRVLHNESVPLTRGTARGGGQPLYLVGVGSSYMEVDSPSVALEEVPAGAARLVVMHNPESFPKFPAGTAPLAIAAHTHGGQARLPFTPEWSWLTFMAQDEVHADGWIEDGYGELGNRLYITRGIGMSVIPLRINCPPELTYFTLSGAR